MIAKSHLETEIARIHRQGLLHDERLSAVDVALRDIADGRRRHLVYRGLVILVLCRFAPSTWYINKTHERATKIPST